MELRIGRHKLKLFNELNVKLQYDSIASTFSGMFYYNVESATDRSIFKPGTYQTCQIHHNNVLLLTGTILSHVFTSAGDPPKHLVAVSGYSRTGVLQDSCILNTTDPIVATNNSRGVSIPFSAKTFEGLNLEQITSLVTSWYNLGSNVDPELKKDSAFTKPFRGQNSHGRFITETKADQSVADYLDNLCKQKNVVLSHTRGGKILITRAKADKMLTDSTTFVKTAPVGGEGQAYVESTGTKTKERNVLWDFSDPRQWTTMRLKVDGQKMHRIIQVVGQHSDGDDGQSLDSAVVNPYVAAGVDRFVRIIQTDGDFSDTPKTARSFLGAELKNIELTIGIKAWTLGGHLVTPNQLVTVRNKELNMNGKSKWFIRDVVFTGNEREQVATLTCVLPACFNDEPVKNELW